MTYLDSAATTMQKPKAVWQAMRDAMKYSASAGRGSYSGAGAAEDILFGCRCEAAELFHMEDPSHVVFTMNATHALNLAIHSMIQPGMRVLISGYEHNAVYRPLTALGRNHVDIDVVSSPPFEPEYFLSLFEQKLRAADAVVCTHVSNVFGYILPIEEVDRLCAKQGVPLIIDASQSAGYLDLDVGKLKAARFVCMPGHKGLYGPQGTGLLLANGHTEPLIYGGTGADSKNRDMPAELPERLEAGTQNIPAVAGLREGIRFVREQGTDEMLAHGRELIELARKELERFPFFRVFAARRLFCQTGVLSIAPRDGSAEAIANRLGEENIAVRAGFHCAPLAHQSAGTADGTLRISVSAFNRARDIHTLIDALAAATGRA